MFYKNKKGSKVIYNVLIREKRFQNKAKPKWEANDTIFNEDYWLKIFERPFKTT